MDSRSIPGGRHRGCGRRPDPQADGHRCRDRRPRRVAIGRQHVRRAPRTYTDPNENVWLYQVNDYGYVTAEAMPETDDCPEQDVWQWKRDADGLPSKYIQPAAADIVDASGNTVTESVPTTYVYVSGNLTEVDYPDGSKEKWEYGIFSQLDSHTDQMGRTQAYTLDTGTTLDPGDGNVETETETSTIDSLTRKTKYNTYTSDPGTDTTDISKVPGGLVESVTSGLDASEGGGPDAVTTLTSYWDSSDGSSNAAKIGLVKQVTSAADTADSSIQSDNYDPNRNLQSVDNGLTGTDERETDYTYDNLNHLVEETQVRTCDSGPVPDTTYGYDGVGNCIWMKVQKDGNPVETDYTFDGMNRQETVVLPDAGTEDMLGGNESQAGQATTTYFYDANGNLTGQQDPVGAAISTTARITSYGYDSRNERTSVSQPAPFDDSVSYPPGHAGYVDNSQPATTYSYDALGNLESEADPRGNTTTYLYDELGRVRETTQPATHDAQGNLMNAAATTEDKYYADGRIEEVDVPGPNGTRVTSYQYDGLGRKSAEILPAVEVLPAGGNGTVYTATPETTYQYDLRDNLLVTANNSGATTWVYTENSYDGLDRLVSTIAPDPNTGTQGPDSLQTIYQYNPAGELSQTSLQPYDANNPTLVGSNARTTDRSIRLAGPSHKRYASRPGQWRQYFRGPRPGDAVRLRRTGQPDQRDADRRRKPVRNHDLLRQSQPAVGCGWATGPKRL